MKKIKQIKLSPWTPVDDMNVMSGYPSCCMRFIEGTNPDNGANRVAFIEKTPRVRVAPYDPEDADTEYDGTNWKQGPKGMGGNCEYGTYEAQKIYGFYPPSRKWCDEELIKMGYILT